MKRRSEPQERFWRKLIGGFDVAGGSVRSWSELHGVSELSFYAWRRKLARRDRTAAESAAPRFVPVRVESFGEFPKIVKVITLGDIDVEFHGDISFYGGCNEPSKEYRARFTNRQLEWIKSTEQLAGNHRYPLVV